MSDCPTPGCTWTNIYMTCQDGSREYAAYQHAQTHEAGRAAENGAGLIGALRDAADKANMDLLAAVQSTCPGDHRPKQHRDRKPPWCNECGRDNRGVLHSTRVTPPASTPDGAQ